MPPTTRPRQQLSYDRLQAEMIDLRDANERLKREITALKRHNTRLKNQKKTVEGSEQEARDSLRKAQRSAETRDKKFSKAQEQIQRLRDKECDRCETYEALLIAEEKKSEELFDQNVRLKQKIAASSMLDNQITDETFRETMSYAYVAIYDCFHGVLRRQDPNNLASRNLNSRQIACSGDIDVTLAEWYEELDMYLPDHRNNTKMDKLHLCIATVAWILAAAVNTGLVFGSPYTERIEAATMCWKTMPEPQNSESQKKFAQWLALTKEILTNKDRETMDNARGFVLEDVLDKSQELLEGLTDLKFTDDVRAELSEALAPFLETMCMLPYQRWQYSFEMVPAVEEDYWTPFDHVEMDGMFAEKTGWIKASLFPRLCRLEQDDEENFERTVICKARVAVQSDPSSIADGTRNDTEMSGCIDEHGVETNVETVESVAGKVTNESLDIIEQERSQSQDRDEIREKELDEPMDRNLMVDALEAGSGVYIDRSKTPKGKASESSIPDSFDRAEDETIGQSRCWPA